ncbi:MAG: site-2 protease family protein [Candidatus Omnitrophica bacterium]|nr:site-2 protease family protein [Candidatus Omnitrophota bacterium]
MKGSIRLFKIFGIRISIHVTFLLLPLVFAYFYTTRAGISTGVRAVFFILFVFTCVGCHELCHSIVAKHFGIIVSEITLLPIGGVASMKSMPEKPSHEFFIAIAGPLFNLVFGFILFIIVYSIFGLKVLMQPSLNSWPQTAAYMVWINPMLAIFNMIPAFPMDGGRVLRSLLAKRLSYKRATEIAVNFGHLFALVFGFIGLTSNPPHIILIVIAVFIYMAASSEELQVSIKETIKQFMVKDVLAPQFTSLKPTTPVSKILETSLHRHQEDFPVVDETKLVGFLTRSDIIMAIHSGGMNTLAEDVMRREFPIAYTTDKLTAVQQKMESSGLKAMPVLKGKQLSGIITLEDISRVYAMMSKRTK